MARSHSSWSDDSYFPFGVLETIPGITVDVTSLVTQSILVSSFGNGRFQFCSQREHLWFFEVLWGLYSFLFSFPWVLGSVSQSGAACATLRLPLTQRAVLPFKRSVWIYCDLP